MEILTKALGDLGSVLFVGLLLGSGLPALFALGMRSLYGELPTEAAAHDAPESVATTGPAGRAIAYVCFGVVVLAVVLGIAVIVAEEWVLGLLGLG